MASYFGDSLHKSDRYLVGGNDDCIYEVRNAYTINGLTIVNTARVVAALIALALGIIFLFLGGFNILNTRIDFNTDFMGRDCTDVDGQVCQERSLMRVHAEEAIWYIAPAFLVIGLSYFWTTSVLMMLYTNKLYTDGVDAECTSRMCSQYGASTFEELPFYSSWRLSIQLVSKELAKGVTLDHNIFHAIYDPIMFSVFLTSYGMRDRWEIITFGVIAISYTFWLLYSQLLHRVPYCQTAANANVAVKRHSPGNVVHWGSLIVFVCIVGIVWSVMAIRAFKFPHTARTWYMILNSIIVLTYLPLHACYQLAYFASLEKRSIIADKAEPSPVAEVIAIARVPFSLRGPWIFLGIAMAVVCFLPYVIFSAVYVVVRWLASAYVALEKSMDSPEAYLSARSLCDLFFVLYDILLLFCSLILLLGTRGHANIAQIVFPTAQTLVY